MTERPILVVGSTMIDLVAFAERLPDAGETVFGSAFLQGFGGKGANQAVMAARFRGPVAMVGAVGDDANGVAILDNLRAQAVDTRDVQIATGSSGVAPIWVDGAGMNRIIVIPGANDRVEPEAARQAVERLAPAVVVGQFEVPQSVTAAAFRAGHRMGATTVLNPAPGAPIDPDLLAVTDWLVPNETEFVLVGGAPLVGSTADQERAVVALARTLGVSLVVTLGDRGVALCRVGDDVSWVSAPSAVAVDSTGAGDAFVGAFAAGLAAGLDPRHAADLGCVAASDSVTRAGTQISYAPPDVARRLLDDALAGAGRPGGLSGR